MGRVLGGKPLMERLKKVAGRNRKRTRTKKRKRKRRKRRRRRSVGFGQVLRWL